MLPEDEKLDPALDDVAIVTPNVVKVPVRYYRDKTQKIVKEPIAPTELVEKILPEIL